MRNLRESWILSLRRPLPSSTSNSGFKDLEPLKLKLKFLVLIRNNCNIWSSINIFELARNEAGLLLGSNPAVMDGYWFGISLLTIPIGIPIWIQISYLSKQTTASLIYTIPIGSGFETSLLRAFFFQVVLRIQVTALKMGTVSESANGETSTDCGAYIDQHSAPSYPYPPIRASLPFGSVTVVILSSINSAPFQNLKVWYRFRFFMDPWQETKQPSYKQKCSELEAFWLGVVDTGIVTLVNFMHLDHWHAHMCAFVCQTLPSSNLAI